MSFAWSRCRRCARTLRDPKTARKGIGPECATKPDAAPTGLAALMDAVDTISEHGHRLPETQRMTQSDLHLYATAINEGAPLRAATRRRILRNARQLKETTP